MNLIVKGLAKPSFAAFADLRRREGGSVLLEFGLIASVLAMFLAGSIDLVFMVSAGRDLERTSAQIAAMVTNGCENSKCSQDRMTQYRDRQTNSLILYPTATLSMVNISKSNNAISVCSGPGTTFISTATNDLALTILDNNDSGVAVTIELNYVPFLPISLASFAKGNTNLVRRTVAILRKTATC